MCKSMLITVDGSSPSCKEIPPIPRSSIHIEGSFLASVVAKKLEDCLETLFLCVRREGQTLTHRGCWPACQ